MEISSLSTMKQPKGGSVVAVVFVVAVDDDVEVAVKDEYNVVDWVHNSRACSMDEIGNLTSW